MTAWRARTRLRLVRRCSRFLRLFAVTPRFTLDMIYLPDSLWPLRPKRWVELYEWHDKYTLVGRLREEAADPAEEEMALFHALEAELSGNHRPFEM